MLDLAAAKGMMQLPGLPYTLNAGARRRHSCCLRAATAATCCHPQVALEVVSDRLLCIVPQPSSERAIRAAGGLRAVLRHAGVDLRWVVAAEEPAAGAQRLPGGRWQQEEAVHFPLGYCEALQALLAKARPPLLTRGSAIPWPTLRAYRCGLW